MEKPKISSLLFYIIIVIIITSYPLRAQFDRLQNYNVKDGLSSSEMYGVMQDAQGYIWSIGDMGVSRFDGYNFQNFSSENGMPDNSVFGIYQDVKNRIWFRPLSGKLSYYENDKIYTLECNDTLEKIFKKIFVTSIYIDKADTIWLGSTSNFLVKIIPGWKKSSVRKIEIPDGKYFINFNKKGLVFGGNYPKRTLITEYNSVLQKINSIDPNFISNGLVNSRFFLIQLSNGHYLASLDNRMLVFQGEKIIHQRNEKSMIIYMQETKNKTIISGTFDGVFVYQNEGLAIKKTIPQLSNKIVTGLCIDKEDGLWMTTEGHGLYYIPYRNFSYYTPQNGISESKISCVGIKDSAVVIGHLDGTASLLYADSISTVSVNEQTKNYAQLGRLTSISNYGDKTIVTTMQKTFYLESNKLKIIPEFSNTIAKKIIRSKDGNIWALHYGRITKYSTKKSFRKIDSSSIKARTDNIFEDSEGKIWLSAVDGVYTYRNKVLEYLGETNKLFAIRAVDICETQNHEIWVATRGGGIIVKRGQEVIQINEEMGLAGNMCRSLFSDSNAVWVGTNKGLSKVTRDKSGKYEIENFYDKNGLLTNEVNRIIRHNNKLWLTHNNGISVFNPSNIKSNTYPPPVYILQTFVNDSLCSQQELKNLSYDKNYLTINYIGLSYKDAGHIEYKYKIVGIDSNWTHTTYTTVKYQTIPPGTYRFMVYAKNNDGYWSKTPATVSFTILHAWWQTFEFKIAVTLFWVLVILLLFKLRLDILRKREQEKAAFKNKIGETELKALRSQMNPHFIFNAINSVQYFITNNDPVSSQKYLAKFAKLIRYVVDNSKPGTIPLNTELEAINLYLELESLRFENRFIYSVIVDESVDVENTQIPSMIIQPYVENSIWHGLMHKKEKGSIEIILEKKDTVLKCIIRDNGIGREQSKVINLANNKTLKKSIGMANTKERLDIINQMNNGGVSVIVTDILDSDNKVTGTCVELNIPM